MLDELYGYSLFAKINLKYENHQIRMNNVGDEWKTAFKTKHDLYNENYIKMTKTLRKNSS